MVGGNIKMVILIGQDTLLGEGSYELVPIVKAIMLSSGTHYVY
jgi:hypothetical protein